MKKNVIKPMKIANLLALIDKEPAIYYLHGLNSICYAKNIKKDFDFKSEKKQQLYKTLLKETTDNLSLYVKILPNSENTQYALNIINEAKELAQETN